MYSETLHQLGEQSAQKLVVQKRSLAGHLIRSAMAGMYVGAAIVLISPIGAPPPPLPPGPVRLATGICFGGALPLVISAGSKLSPGKNLTPPGGVLTRRSTLKDLGANWTWT